MACICAERVAILEGPIRGTKRVPVSCGLWPTPYFGRHRADLVDKSFGNFAWRRTICVCESLRKRKTFSAAELLPKPFDRAFSES